MKRPDISKIKNKSVREYIEHLEAQQKTPYFEGFLTLKRMVDKGNSQIKDATMDVFSEDGEKEFAQAAKFTAQLKGWYAEMEYFKSKMDPKELEELEKGVTKPDGVEEYLSQHGKL